MVHVIPDMHCSLPYNPILCCGWIIIALKVAVYSILLRNLRNGAGIRLYDGQDFVV